VEVVGGEAPGPDVLDVEFMFTLDGSMRLVEFVGGEAPEPDVLEVDFMFTLGGGSFRRLVLSLDGDDGGDSGEDDCSAGLEDLPLVAFFVAVVVVVVVLLLLVLPLGGGVVYEFAVGGGGGMTRLGPFDGK
jgi:hypothetical protein